ncbi:MAG: hypothetical protein HQ534_01445 [Armatimonadetes bacterium]|nr:hypothetical protein [Armatimonadota bacterium]
MKGYKITFEDDSFCRACAVKEPEIIDDYSICIDGNKITFEVQPRLIDEDEDFMCE